MKVGRFNIEIKEMKEFLLVEVSIDGVMEPEELSELIKNVEGTVGSKYFGKGVVISGRLPIWAHSALAHLFHPANFVAHFDPRLKGGVVVASHDNNYKIGQVVR